ncbi:MAG: hypothetical protein ACE5FM_05860, partial [Methyloligellaceae bacterium]
GVAIGIAIGVAIGTSLDRKNKHERNKSGNNQQKTNGTHPTSGRYQNKKHMYVSVNRLRQRTILLSPLGIIATGHLTARLAGAALEPV